MPSFFFIRSREWSARMETLDLSFLLCLLASFLSLTFILVASALRRSPTSLRCSFFSFSMYSPLSLVILFLFVLSVRLRKLIHHSLRGISSVEFVNLTGLFPSISLSGKLQMTLIFSLLATLLLSPGFILDISLKSSQVLLGV